MANPTTSNPSTEDTSLLLGWGSSHISGSGIGNGDEQWTSLHFRVRTTAEGLEAFKRALRILSGEDGRIDFSSRNNSDGVSLQRDPLLVVAAYFRLLRCTLEPVEPQNSSEVISENEWIQFTKSLLKNLGGSLKSSIQQQIELLKEGSDSSHGQGDRSDNTRRNSTILLFFRSMINHVAPHVARNSSILGQTYKIFSELADLFATLLEIESTTIAGLVTKFVPVVGISALSSLEQDVDQLNDTWDGFNDCLKRGALCLLESMQEGLLTLQRALSGQQQFASKPDGFSKIMVFVMARTISLMFLRRRRIQQGKLNLRAMLRTENKSSVDESDDGESSLISQCLLLLIKIRSLSVLINGCLDDAPTRSHLDDGRLKLFEMLTGLGLRVDVYTEKLLCLTDPNAQTHSIWVGLQYLADLPPEQFNIAFSVCGVEDDAISMENCFQLGKLFVMKHVLETLRQPTSGLLVDEFSSTTLVRLCESAIFTDLPSIHHFFRLQSPRDFVVPAWASKFVSDMVSVLESSTRALFVSNSNNTSRQSRIRQHHQLLRWLAGTHNNSLSSCQRFRPNHPFSNEIIMHIIQTRIITCTASSKTNQDAHDLISLMAKLMFHQRTQTSHRRLIVTVLERLLSASMSESINAKMITVNIIWTELKGSTAFDPAEIFLGKRKRKTPNFPLLDACEICRVLEILIGATVSLHIGINDTIIHEMRLIWDSILRNSESNNQIKQQSTFSYKQIFALSLIIGSMRCQPNVGSIQHMLDGQNVEKSVQTVAFIDGSLAFIHSFLAPMSGKSKRIFHHHICIRYIGALVALFGREFTERNIHRIGIILKNMYSASSTSTVEDVNMQNLLISTASKMGVVIQPGFNEKSMKPLIDIMSQFLAKPNWLYIASGMTNAERFLSRQNSHRGLLAGLLIKAMPGVSKPFLTSRLKGDLFCLTSEQIVEDLSNLPYYLQQESKFLLSHSISAADLAYRLCLGDRIIQLKAGSKLLFYHDDSGRISSFLLVPPGKDTADCSTQFIESNCEMLLRIR